jgi:UrcA family protein
MTKLLLAASAAIMIASPALAANVVLADDVPRQAVSTRDVDFANPAQAKHFYAKLSGAAVAVCDSNAIKSRPVQLDRACIDQAMSQAVKTLGQPVLTAMYDHAQTSNRAFAGNDQ